MGRPAMGPASGVRRSNAPEPESEFDQFERLRLRTVRTAEVLDAEVVGDVVGVVDVSNSVHI
jgi:hypothetical protein